MLPFTSAGGAKPIAGRGGLEGFTPPHRFKARTAASDGQRASTRAARSAGHNFAVILLSKTMDVGRDHLIHRKRSPFPYEGKDLTRSKLRRDCPGRRDTSHFRMIRTSARNASRRGTGLQVTSSTAERSPFPSRGRTRRARFGGVVGNVGHPWLSRTSSTASGPPSPRGATADAVLTSSTANAVPLPLIGEGLKSAR